MRPAFSVVPALALLAGAAGYAPARAGAAQEAAPVVRRVEVSGTRAVPARALEDAARAAVGKAGDAASVRAAADAVVAEYRRRGLPVAQVVSTDLLPDGTLRLTVAEGTVRSIVVRGNSKTRVSTIRTAMGVAPGDVYREDRVAADRDRLARLGIFEDVVIAPDVVQPGPGVADDTVGLVDVVVRVRERRTGNVAASLGYGEPSGLVGFVDLSETNFAGLAQRVSVQFQRVTYRRFRNDPRRQEDYEARSAYRVSYFAPFLGGSRTALGVELYDQNTVFQPLFTGDDETLRDFERREGATVRVGRELGRGLSVFLSGRRDRIGYEGIPGNLDINAPVEDIQEAIGTPDATVGALGVELIADARDAAENPRRGYRYSLLYENAGSFLGGNRRFAQTVLDARHYLPLSGGASGPVLAFRVLGGTSSGSVPLPEQFWIGGYELLRGYDLYSIRGDRLLLTSAEARVPLSQAVQGALFVDYGNAWRPGENLSLADLRAGAGVGLRFLTPIGPIRVDAAYGDGLKTYASLGHAF